MLPSSSSSLVRSLSEGFEYIINKNSHNNNHNSNNSANNNNNHNHSHSHNHITRALTSHLHKRSRSDNNLIGSVSYNNNIYIKDNYIFLKPLQLEKSISEPVNNNLNSSSSSSSELPDSIASLTNLPSHTNPLTRTRIISPYETFLTILLNMGFTYNECEVALIYTRCVSVEVALDFITRNPDAIYHTFKSKREYELNSDSHFIEIDKNSLDTICTECGLARVFHLIDAKHEIIEVKASSSEYLPKFNLEELLGDDNNFNEILLRLAFDPLNENLSEIELIDMTNRILNSNKKSSDFFREDTMLFNDSLPSPINQLQLLSLSRAQSRGPIVLSDAAKKFLEEAEDEPEKEVGPDDLLCNICGEYFNKNNFHIGSSCGHSFCLPCLQGFYKVKISSLELEILCAEPSCKRKVDEHEILLIIKDDAELIEKYNKFKLHLEAARNPNARWCPKPGCQTVIIGSVDKPKLVCATCETTICFNCNQNWHSGKCTDALDDQYAEWARDKDIQNCPQCRVRIEKNLGCNHMTCPVCKHQFCWLCRGDYSDNHFSPFNPFGCPGMQFALEDPDEFRPGPVLIWIFRIFSIPLILAFGSSVLGLLLGGYFIGVGLLIALFPIFLAIECYESIDLFESASGICCWPCICIADEYGWDMD